MDRLSQLPKQLIMFLPEMISGIAYGILVYLMLALVF